jgi:hypothetical protein
MKNLIRSVLVISILLSASCGGGTSGTSTSGDFRLTGRVVDGSGRPQADTSMSAVAAQTGEAILFASTEGDGSFRMELPTSNAQVQIDVGGARTTAIAKTLEGPVTISTQVVVNGASASAQGTFEAQVDAASICSNFVTDQNMIVQIESDPLPQCMATVRLVSNQIAQSDFRAQVVGVCDGRSRIFAEASSAGGALSIDLSGTQDLDCEDVYLEVFAMNQPSRARFSIFPLGRKTDGSF